MRRRTFLASVAATGLAAPSLVACTSPKDTSGSGSPSQSTITFLSWDNQETMKPVLAAFSKAHPDITVKFTYAPPVPGYIQKLQTQVLSKQAPDVFLIAAENRTNLIQGKFVENLVDKPYMKEIPELNKAAYGSDGAAYGLSMASWGSGIGYNKKMLAKVRDGSGLPETWDEFFPLCEKLTTAGMKPYLEAVEAIPTVLTAFLGATNAKSNNTMDKQLFDGSSSFVDYWTEPLKQYQRLFTEKVLPPSVVGLKGEQVTDEFARGKLAMAPLAPWDIPTIRKAAPDLDFEIVNVPGASGLSPYLAGAPSPGYAISSSSKVKEAADAFLTFLASPEGAKIYHDSSGAITVTSDYTPKVDKALAPIVESVRKGGIYLAQTAWLRDQDALALEATAQIQRLAQGEATPTDVAQALDRKLASA